MKNKDLSAAKRATAIRLVEKGTRLKKWLCICIALGITLATVALALD